MIMGKLFKENNSWLKSTLIGVGIFLIIICGMYVKEPYSHISQYILMMIVFLIASLIYKKKNMLFQFKMCKNVSIFAMFCSIYELIKLLR